MRVLLLLRGSAGCGKSTWIEQNGLKPYALSADDIRLLCQSPVLQPDGTVGISQRFGRHYLICLKFVCRKASLQSLILQIQKHLR